MDSLSAAAQDVIARGMPLTTAARKHGVPRTTLRWRMAAMERELAGQQVISKSVKTALCLYDIHWPYQDQQSLEMVAPRAGAWIEALADNIAMTVGAGRSPCGSVD